MCRILTRYLNLEGYHINSFTEARLALDYIAQYQPDVILTDIKMPDYSGMDILKSVREKYPDTIVIIMTAYATIEGAIQAMKEGAYHYVTKPFNLEEILLTIGKAVEMSHLSREQSVFSEQIRRAYADLSLVGKSPAIEEVKRILEKISPTDSSVLIIGESGTGKELAAKFIHKASNRADRRFVPIDCACIPENLLESELFGHEKGAFTGASQTKLGLIEMAHGGTLFLDEIGELPLQLQSKLLRVLQEHRIQRVGGLKQIPVDIRLLAATNRDLQIEMEEKRFRQDLFYRLNVINIILPPLREREGDIPVLVDYFLNTIGARLHKKDVTITPAAMEILCRYPWPGNVRELENVLERSLVLLEGGSIRSSDVPSDIRGALTEEKIPSASNEREIPIDYHEARNRFETEYLRELLNKAGGSVTEAAKISGISRRNLYEKMEKLGIVSEEFKKRD